MSERFKQPKIIYFESRAAKGTVMKEMLVQDIAGNIARRTWDDEYFKDECDVSMRLVILPKPEYDRISGILRKLGELSGEQSNKALAGQMKPYSLKETLDFIAGDAKPVNTISNGDFSDGAKSWDEKKQTATPFEKYTEHYLFDALRSIRESPGFMVDKGMHPFECEAKEINGVLNAQLKGKVHVSKHYVIMKDAIYKKTTKVYHPRAPKPKFQTLNEYTIKRLGENPFKKSVTEELQRMFMTIASNLANIDANAPDVCFEIFEDRYLQAFFTKDGKKTSWRVYFDPMQGCKVLRADGVRNSNQVAIESLDILRKTINFKVTPNYFYDYDARAEYKDKGGK